MSTTRTTSTGLGELLSVDETARLLRVSTSTVRRLARRGELPSLRVGRQWRIERDGLVAAGRTPQRRKGSR